jgi:hypothetical protein
LERSLFITHNLNFWFQDGGRSGQEFPLYATNPGKKEMNPELSSEGGRKEVGGSEVVRGSDSSVSGSEAVTQECCPRRGHCRVAALREGPGATGRGGAVTW